MMKKIIPLLLLPASLFSQTWATYNTGNTLPISSIDFPSADTGYVVNEVGACRKTVNGANSWTAVVTPGPVLGIDFATSQIGFITMDSTVYQTFNGGTTWAPVLNGGRISFGKIFAVDANTIYVSGINGYTSHDTTFLFKSINGGGNWTIVNTIPTPWQPISTICFSNSMNGCFAADFSIQTTANGGTSWTMPYNDLTGNDYIEHIDFPNADTGYACDYQLLLKTTDAGTTFNPVNNPGIEMFDLHFNNGQTGFISGSSGINSGWVQQTVDGGNTWTVIYSSSHSYYCLSFPDDLTGYFGGDNGTVLKYSMSPNGIMETSQPEISIFPNPAQNSILISNTQSIDFIKIYSQNGQLLKEQTAQDGRTMIDLTGFPAGVYSVEVSRRKNSNKKTIMFEKQH